MTLHTLDRRTSIVDLKFQGFDLAIGTGVLETGEGVALVDPGPTTCLAALEAGLGEAGFGLADVRAVLLTHIHLDHATAAGTIVSRVPEARVYVHPAGAIHMIRPERLLASAGRIYGDRMETLWGEFLPVPAESVTAVDEGGTVRLAACFASPTRPAMRSTTSPTARRTGGRRGWAMWAASASRPGA